MGEYREFLKNHSPNSRHTCTAPHLPWYGLSRTVPGNTRSPRSKAEWECGASVRVKNSSVEDSRIAITSKFTTTKIRSDFFRVAGFYRITVPAIQPASKKEWNHEKFLPARDRIRDFLPVLHSTGWHPGRVHLHPRSDEHLPGCKSLGFAFLFLTRA